jgi:hypothetical protein
MAFGFRRVTNTIGSTSYVESDYLLQKTGQTTDLTPAGYTAKDDGNIESGVAKSYEILTSGQYSGTTNITVNAKTDAHSNNCVRDLTSQLMWSRYPSASVGPSSDGTLYWDDTGGSDEDVFAYCDAANAASLGGYTDWRVPNWFEACRLPDYEQASAAPDSTAFPSAFGSSGTIWTSTSQENVTTNAKIVSDTDGWMQGNVKTTALYNVLLVRSYV